MVGRRGDDGGEGGGRGRVGGGVWHGGGGGGGVCSDVARRIKPSHWAKNRGVPACPDTPRNHQRKIVPRFTLDGYPPDY